MMASKTSNTSIRPIVVVASSSTSKVFEHIHTRASRNPDHHKNRSNESSPTTNDKVSKKSRNNSKSTSKNHEGKSRKRKKRQHKSKKNQEPIDDPPPLPPSDDKIVQPPPPPPPPLSNLYDDIDETITTSSPIIKTNLPLSHSPPPVMPTILRQGSRSRLTTIEQLVPSSVVRTKQSNNNNNNENKLLPTSTTNLNNPEDLATKKFEEQLALLDATSSKLTMNNWDQSSGSEEDEQIERICRMNNTANISGPIQFKFNRTQNLPLKTSPVSNDIKNEEEEEETVPIMNSTKKKRLHKPNDPSNSPHSSSSNDEKEKKKQKKSENETTTTTTAAATESVPTNELPPIKHEEEIKTEVIKTEEPVASSSNEKKANDGHHSRSTSASSSKKRRKSSRRRHRHRRRHSSTSSSRSSYSSTSSDSSRSSSRSHRRRRRRRSRSSRSSSRSSSSSSDNRGRHSSRSSSRSYSRRRSSSSRSSRSSTTSRSSHSRSRSRSHNRKSSRRSSNNNNHHQQQSNNNGKGRGGAGNRRGRGARNGPRGRRAQSNENAHRSTPNRNGIKYNSTLGGGIRKLPVNKQPRVLIAATPKPSPNEEIIENTATTINTPIGIDEIKTEPIILTTNQNLVRPSGQKKNAKGKNKQQTPAYSLKKEDIDGMDHDNGEPMIGPKLPPEFEKKINKEHSFTPPDMDDPENIEMLNDLKYRAEIHAAKNHGLISEIQAQQLIEDRETQKQLAELPLIPMPIMPSPTISSMGSFIVAAPSYQLQMAPASNNPDNSSVSLEQQQQLSPNSATSSGGESCSTPGQTTPSGTTTVLTQDGQPMMIQTSPNMNQQLVQITQPSQPLYMSMQSAVQQPRVVAVRTPQGGLQHFIEYPTAQLLQAQQQQQQPQFIQHNGQLVQVIRPPMGYSSQALLQQLQLQQQQQVMAAQLQAQQIAAMQQSGGAIFLQNSAGQFVLAQPSPQQMRVVQLPYVPK